jgi:hypothetical protein
MAEARDTLDVPWIDLCFKASATGLVLGGPVPPVRGGLAAIDTASGHILWKHNFNQIGAGAPTSTHKPAHPEVLAYSLPQR